VISTDKYIESVQWSTTL